MPTRLIDIGLEDGIIRLHETNDDTDAERYVALSHCWGPSKIIKTTIETLEARKRAIPPEHLSRTFSEAIQVARRLKLKYIWIDSVCIIQNDKADWAKEAATMASRYRNAFLTISATRSSGGDSGLFAPTLDFEGSGSTPAGEEYCVFFREQMNQVRTNELDHSHPLFSRVWCYQERLLSTRVLHFGPQELFFECLTDSKCECGDNFGYEIPLPKPKLEFAEVVLNQDATKYYIARIWRAMVSQYCDLALTISSDRLPALGGAARLLAEIRKSRYLAGLWEDSLIDDVRWEGHGWHKKRPSAWRAPSWYWASIDGSAYYRDAPFVWNSDDAQEERSTEDFKAFGQVISFSTVPSGPDEFGELESAVLTLFGPCFDVLLTSDREDVNSSSDLVSATRRGSINRVNPTNMKVVPNLEGYIKFFV